MFSVYVLRSLKNGKQYIGYTGKDVADRLKEHNRGINTWTRQNGPFKLIYHEEVELKGEAIERERFFKSGQGRKYLKEVLKSKNGLIAQW